MTEDREPTPEEVEANVAKATAEAAKFIAEAKVAEAEAAKAWADAKASQLALVKKEAEAEKAQRAYELELAADEHHHVYQYTGDVNQAAVDKCKNQLTAWHRADPGQPMEVVFFSPGGLVFPGFDLYDRITELRADGADITTGARGYAASMGGILLQAGTTRWCGPRARIMIHRVKSGAIGSTFELEDEVAFCKSIEKTILEIFVDRSEGKLTAARIKNRWKRQDWWINAQEALEYGLVDEIRG